ncbi:MAG: LPS export ABC transporter permease LptF [gamma proteobacterium symbiont of Bathyaustriella thionipta]|nr:LPS export ABC transporter permease LptF [gamma proteobacterium symbiont of Bathyaustriella thionipta]
MFAILDRYLLSEVVKIFLAALLVAVLLMTTNGFVKLLAKVSDGSIAPGLIAQLLGFQMIRFLPPLIPLAWFFAMLFAIGRLYRDNEMTAIRACGLGTIRIFRGFVLPVLLLAGLTLWLTLWARPWSIQAQDELLNQQQDMADLAGLVTGKFNESHRGNLVFYVEGVSQQGDRMKNIFVQNRQHGSLGIVSAKSAYQFKDENSDDIFIVLENGYRYEGEPGSDDFRFVSFAEYGLRIRQEKKTDRHIRTKAKPISDLWQADDLGSIAEFHQRLAFPVAVILFGILAIPLSYSMPRQGVYGRLFIALLIFFSYFNLIAVGTAWIEKALLPSWLGLWWLHAAMAMLAVALLGQESSLLRRWRRKKS